MKRRHILGLLLFIGGPPKLFQAFKVGNDAATSRRSTAALMRPNQSLVALQAASSFDTSFMWNRGLNFGKGNFKFYDGFLNYMSAFPKEDQEAYPELFRLPEGLYECRLRTPLGIVFEEIQIGRGVYAKDLVPGGNAERDGTIKANDVLVGITAVKVVGAKFERRLIPARDFDFDTAVNAIQSNDQRYGCSDVILIMERPSEATSSVTDDCKLCLASV
jgi:hypothetical protein